MKRAKITFWICTGLLSFMMLGASVADLIPAPEAVAGFKGLGYPVYLLGFLGVARILGVAALLTPRFPRLKEWAYAGFAFDMIGALYSMIAVGTPAKDWLPVLLPVALLAGSYLAHHALLRRKAIVLSAQNRTARKQAA